MLIFVHSRAECGKTAKALRDLAVEKNQLEYFVKSGSATQEILQEEISTVKHAEFKGCTNVWIRHSSCRNVSNR